MSCLWAFARFVVFHSVGRYGLLGRLKVFSARRARAHAQL